MRAIWAENSGYLAVIRRGSKTVRMLELPAFWRLAGERVPSRIMMPAGEKPGVNGQFGDADGARPREGVSESYSETVHKQLRHLPVSPSFLLLNSKSKSAITVACRQNTPMTDSADGLKGPVIIVEPRHGRHKALHWRNQTSVEDGKE
jgi:hypothetical protein